MPQLHSTVDPQQFFTERERVLLQVLLQEINTLRQAAGLPVRTQQQFKDRVRQQLIQERRGGRA